MDLCSVAVNQIDDTHGEIRTIIATEVFHTLNRKKRNTDEFFKTVELCIKNELLHFFGDSDEPELALKDVQHRSHAGWTNQFIPFVSVLTIFEISEGEGLTNTLTEGILRKIKDELVKEEVSLTKEEVVDTLIRSKGTTIEEMRDAIEKALHFLRV